MCVCVALKQNTNIEQSIIKVASLLVVFISVTKAQRLQQDQHPPAWQTQTKTCAEKQVCVLQMRHTSL